MGRFILVNRTLERGQQLLETLVGRLRCQAELVHWTSEYALPAGTDIIINGTSIGLYDAEARLPFDVNTLQAGQIVADVVFSPPVTRLLQDGAARGCKTLDGLSMLVNRCLARCRSDAQGTGGGDGVLSRCNGGGNCKGFKRGK